MTGVRSAKPQSLSRELSVPRSNPGVFETIPRIPTIAPPSTSPRAQDKVIIITGCNSPLGIGRATAHQFASQSARAIYISDFDSTHLDTHVRELAELYPNTEVHARKIDAGKEEDIKSLVAECMAKYDRLDIFFANAGVSGTMERVFDEGGKGGEGFMECMRVNALRYLTPLLSLHTKFGTDKHQCLPSNEIRLKSHAANLRIKTLPKRVHNRHSLRSRPSFQRRTNRLLSLQSRRHINHADIRLPTRRHRSPV